MRYRSHDLQYNSVLKCFPLFNYFLGCINSDEVTVPMPLVEQEYIQNLQEQIYYLELEASYMYEFDLISQHIFSDNF